MCCSCAERPGLRRAQPARPRGDDRRRPRRGRAVQARPGRFRAVEAEREGVIGWDSPVGPGASGLAHRMLGDDRARILAKRSTSTAAGSTSSSRTMRTRSPRAAAPMAARRSRATGCTTASSTWARRRCRRASAISSRRRSCWRRGTRRDAALALLSAHYRQPLPWTEALIAQSKATLDRLYRDVGDAEARRARRGRARGAIATISTRRWRCRGCRRSRIRRR